MAVAAVTAAVVVTAVTGAIEAPICSGLFMREARPQNHHPTLLK
jgi:hypothetical protein